MAGGYAMDTNDVIRIYSAASVADSSLIEDAFSTNGIEYFCSEDLAVITGQPAYQYYIKRADAVRAVELLKNLYVADALSDDFDKSQLDALYEKVVRAQSRESEKLSASLLQDLFNIFIRPFARTISFVMAGMIVYFGGIAQLGMESISDIYKIVSLSVAAMLFGIDLYMKKQKKKARADETQDLFNTFIRPFTRTISFVIVGMIVYFGGIMRPGRESISIVYLIVAPIITVMVFCIDMYMKNQKKKARTDEMPFEND